MLFKGNGAHDGLSVVLAGAIMDCRIALGNDGGSRAAPRPPSRSLPPRTSIAHIILPLAAVEATGAQATCLESFFRSRKGTDRCARVSRSAPCRRGRCDRRGARAFQTDNPRLRLRVTSKARQVVKIVIALHDTPPWLGALGTRLIWQRGLKMSSQPDGFHFAQPVRCTTGRGIGRGSKIFSIFAFIVFLGLVPSPPAKIGNVSCATPWFSAAP